MKHGITGSKQTPAILLVDSITEVEAADQGKIVVSASHGGISSARFALEVPLALVFFNDWGIGKDEAGIAALAMLVDSGVPSACISQNSARTDRRCPIYVGTRLISRVNQLTGTAGIVVGEKLSLAAINFLGMSSIESDAQHSSCSKRTDLRDSLHQPPPNRELMRECSYSET